MRVAIIGNFDGVHGGHRALIRRAREYAGDGPGDRVVAVTFDRHPAAVLRPDQAPAALATAQRRSVLLREAGADEVVVLPFTLELASRTPEEFARLLREDPSIAADAVIVGRNFRFGAKAAGDTAMLTSLGRDLGFVVEVVPLVSEEIPGGTEGAWSSTRIRASIAAGELEAASAMLGRPHRLEGTVVRGDQRGRELGYPTANVEVVAGLAIPPDGVYAGWLVVAGEPMPAAVSIGTNPQFSGSERRVEAYAIGRDDLDIYGDSVAVDLVARLRGQEVFASVEDLVEQMGRDVAAAQELLTG
ncbi:MAG: bifunctional riboflavin kinase/FAD synthetase [Candidatus Nanopelagicales bacterium]